MAGLEQNFKNGSRAVAARDCDWWGCCNSSQQRFYNSTAARTVMTCDISFLRSDCETSVYCFVADLQWRAMGWMPGVALVSKSYKHTFTQRWPNFLTQGPNSRLPLEGRIQCDLRNLCKNRLTKINVF